MRWLVLAALAMASASSQAGGMAGSWRQSEELVGDLQEMQCKAGDASHFELDLTVTNGIVCGLHDIVAGCGRYLKHDGTDDDFSVWGACLDKACTRADVFVYSSHGGWGRGVLSRSKRALRWQLRDPSSLGYWPAEEALQPRKLTRTMRRCPSVAPSWIRRASD